MGGTNAQLPNGQQVSLPDWPGDLVCAEGRYEAKDEIRSMNDETGKERTGAGLHNSSFKPVSPPPAPGRWERSSRCCGRRG